MLATSVRPGALKINDDTRGWRDLPIHSDADILNTVASDADVALPRSHHRVREIDDEASRRIKRRDFRRQSTPRLELDTQSVLAVRDLEPLQCSARGQTIARHVSRVSDQHERHQRNQ